MALPRFAPIPPPLPEAAKRSIPLPRARKRGKTPVPRGAFDGRDPALGLRVGRDDHAVGPAAAQPLAGLGGGVA